MTTRAEEVADSAPMADVAAQVRVLLEAAEKIAFEKHAELDAVRIRLGIARASASTADAEVKRLRRAVDALEGTVRPTGRPRGSHEVNSRNELVRQLLPTRPEWTGVELRSALAEQGHDLSANRVSAALAALRGQGDAVRIGRNRWRASSPSDAAPDDDAGEPS